MKKTVLVILTVNIWGMNVVLLVLLIHFSLWCLHWFLSISPSTTTNQRQKWKSFSLEEPLTLLLQIEIWDVMYQRANERNSNRFISSKSLSCLSWTLLLFWLIGFVRDYRRYTRIKTCTYSLFWFDFNQDQSASMSTSLKNKSFEF